MPDLIDIRDAFFDELYQIAKEDADVVFMAADMGAFSLERFRKDFPDRFINVGISEQNLISSAAGLAMSGKKVFVYAIIPFVTLRCLEQIKVDFCVMNLPVTIIGAGAGFTYSSDGPTHHAIEDVSVMRALPGMTIYNPSDQVTAQSAAQWAYQATGPVYVRLDKGVYPVRHERVPPSSSGMETLKSGRDLLIISTGCMTHCAMSIAEDLAGEGIDAGVVDLFRLKPLDKELIGAIEQYQAVVTLEEHTLPGAMGSSIVELLSDAGVSRPVKRLGIADCYPDGYGDREWMRKLCSIDIEAINNDIINFKRTYVSELTLDNFAQAYDISAKTIPEECQQLIQSTDYKYIVLEGSEKERLILNILKKIDSDQQIIAAPERESIWNTGWEENLNDFIESGYDLKKLVPRFIRPNQYFRLFGNYVKVENMEFEHDFVKTLRSWLFATWFDKFETIYEFGCGTGHNLVELAKMFPDKQLVGLDFVPSSCQLVEKLGTELGYNITSQLFNMMKPEQSYRLCRDSLVFTFGVIEQLGGNFHKYVDYILDNSPGLCIHIEPIYELYDQENLFDYLAAKFHDKRGYTKGYLTYLQQLEHENKLKILKIKRTGFGSLMMEGYSLLIWQPK